MFYEIVLDAGETANKCTIAPLAYRKDFQLLSAKGAGAIGPLRAPVLLHHQGGCITSLRNESIDGIASIDCVWRRLDGLVRRVENGSLRWVRIPDGFETAYPRKSKSKEGKEPDPAGGLATIEAIFVAAALLGNWDTSLLSEYYFGSKFIEMNRDQFLALGVFQASHPQSLPIRPHRKRTSLQRRFERGRKSAVWCKS